MFKFLVIISIFFSIQRTIYAQEIPIPVNYSIISSVRGNLDNDTTSELVVAYDTAPVNDTSYESTPRMLIIYKLKNNTWIKWKESKQALLGSRDGGMMGDPFDNIVIENKILKISHFGGSSWKWNTTDIYRFQKNDFYLIGFTSYFGKHCEEWEDEDVNLSTGKIVVTHEEEKCDSTYAPIDEPNKKVSETTYKKGIIITLEKRHERDIVVITPKGKHHIYIAHKND